MKIDIDHIAKLARLKMDGSEREKFSTQMNDIIAMVEDLPELTGTAVALDPSHPMALRPDVVIPCAAKRDELLANAPKVEAGCVVVPRIVE